MPVIGRLALVTLAFVLHGACARPGHAAEPAPEVERALRAVEEMRLRVAPASEATEDRWQPGTFGGRPVLEIRGRAAAGADAGRLRLEAAFDLGVGRVVSFVWFPHESARKAGEPIVSLSEASTRADATLRRILHGADIGLAGIERYRASGQDAVYYEAAFADPGAAVPFLAPPVRLLLDASTGNLYRFEVDAAWFAPPRLPAVHLSRRAAERVAAAALAARDLSDAFGPGARFGTVAAAEAFVVRPNEWLAAPGAQGAAEARVAWVVPFSLAADPARHVHRLFVDAGSGRILGGLPGAR